MFCFLALWVATSGLTYRGFGYHHECSLYSQKSIGHLLHLSIGYTVDSFIEQKDPLLGGLIIQKDEGGCSNVPGPA